MYGLEIRSADNKVQLHVGGRYFKFHSRYTQVTTNKSTFTINIPGMTAQGWAATLSVTGVNSNYIRLWYTCGADTLTVTLKTIESTTRAATVKVLVFKG